MSWASSLSEEIAETFRVLTVPTFAGFQTFTRTLHESKKERLAREEKERRELERLAYHRERWIALREAPLVAVEKDGIVWMMPPSALDRKRAAARDRQRAIRDTK